MKLNITIEIDDAEIARLLGRDEPQPKASELGRDDPQPKASELRCGLSYLNRAGEGPICISMMDNEGDFRGDDGFWYHRNGKYLAGRDNDPRDLIIPA